MVFRCWRELPPPVVLDAVDRILDRAKEADDNREDNSRIGISTRNGDAYFASRYAFRLFQLMPVLEELDKSRAESLLRETNEVEVTLEKYPQGLGSLNFENGSVYTVGTEDTSNQAQFMIGRRQNEVIDEVSKDPKQALADAMTMPLKGALLVDDYSPRAVTLHIVARMTATKAPAVSKLALEELEKLMAQMAPPAQAHIRADLPEMYLRLGDEDHAVKALDELVNLAGKIYERDSEAGDPNRAFKGMWPSAALWRRCIRYAVKLDAARAEQIIEEIRMLQSSYSNALHSRRHFWAVTILPYS